MTVIAMPRAQRPRKLRIFRNDVDALWYAECPCGWWHCDETWNRVCAYAGNHWAYSFKHAAATVSRAALDRFNVGGKP